MNAMDMIVNFFKQGGVFLYPIAAVFVLGLAVAIERFIYLTRVSSGNRRLWDELSPLIAAGNIRGAMQVAEKTDSALSTIMRYGMSRISTARRREDRVRESGNGGRHDLGCDSGRRLQSRSGSPGVGRCG